MQLQKVVSVQTQTQSINHVHAFRHLSSVVLCISHSVLFVLTYTSLPFDLLGQVLCHRFVGKEDLRVLWAGVTKLVSFVGIFQVTRQTFQICRDVKVAILLAHHLGKRILKTVLFSYSLKTSVDFRQKKT